MTGIRKQHVSRTVKKLIERKIVTKSGNKLALNPNFTQWRELPKQVTITSSDNNVTSTRNKSNQYRGTQKKKETIQKKPETSFGYFDNSKDRVSESIIKEIAEKIDLLQEKASDRRFHPVVFVRASEKSGIPAELINDILGELIKQSDRIKNYWGYAVTILKREEGNYNYARNLERHYALQQEEKAWAGEFLEKIGRKNS
jgi:hypothetical protein